MKPTDKEIEKWTKVREHGMWHFVLLKGALAWGLLVASSVLLVIFLTSGLQEWRVVLVAHLVCSVAGTLLSHRIWQRMEEAYLERQIKPWSVNYIVP